MSERRVKRVVRSRSRKTEAVPAGVGLPRALRDLVEGLSQTANPSMIIGGVAVIAHGVPRLTRDVDGTVVGAGTDLRVLLTVLAKHSIVPRIENAEDFASLNQVLLLRHSVAGVDIDLSLAWLPFELEAIAAAELVTIHGVRVPLPRPEDLVIYKLVAWRPQDRQDVERLLALHGDRMDLARVRRFGLEIAAMLDDPERADEIERLLREYSER